jgi:glycosyltransferase involved in cell wall biosynthesis
MRIALGRPDPLDPDRSRDGIAVYATALGEALRGCGQDIELTEWWYPSRLRGRDGAGFVAPFKVATVAAILLGATPGARNIAHRADVFHATDYRIPRLRRTPVVATLHDAVAIAHPEWVRRGTWLRVLLTRTIAGWAQRVICVSRTSATDVMSAFRVPDRIVRVVYPGVDECFFRDADTNDASPALSAELGRGYFLFVGTLQPRKNLARVIAAHRSLGRAERTEHRLVVVGRYGWGCEEIRRELAEYCREGFATWLGGVAHESMPALYRQALALVFPSLYEGFGLPVLEAFAMRTPVIASTAGALPEVAGGAALLVNPFDVGEIAAAMRCIARGESQVTANVEAGAKRAKAFPWHQTGRQTLEVYREVG